MQIISIMLALLSGVALFLYGMSLMGIGLKRVAGNSLEQTLFKLTSTPIKGVLLGAGVTAIIQSSSATTVMVIGFVNSGMMKVAQAIGVVMGANIGTSITGWILCLSYIEGGSGIATLLSTATISAVVAIVGVCLKNFTKRSVYHNVGDIMLGFAILMVGMQTMSGAVSPLKESETFLNLFTVFSNPFLGILLGIAITAVLQSASASVGILQALSMTGVITFANAFPIILGIGIGAACPVLISSLSSNSNGKRTAICYLLNDALGCVLWGIIFYATNAIVHFEFMDLVMQPVGIAALNSVYRILTIMLLLPFIKAIEKLLFWIIKETPEDLEEQADFDLLEDRFLNYPGLAISQSQKAMNGMAKTARKNVFRSLKLLDEFTEKKMDKVHKKEDLLDKYEDKLGKYLMQLSKQSMNTAQIRQVSKFLHTLSDFERLGDYAVNIGYTAREMNDKKIKFSSKAENEIAIIREAVEAIVSMTTESFIENDLSKAAQVEPLREVINELCATMKKNHIIRLQKGNCSIDQGFPFNDLLTAYERIAGHCSNIAIAVMESDSQIWEAHEIAHNRLRTDEGYITCLKVFQERYSLDKEREIKESKDAKDTKDSKDNKESRDKDIKE